MSYIYDILLNFNTKYYDFFEWNKNDEITHIKKIPIFKTASEDFLKIKLNTVKFSENLLNLIENKTEIFKKNYTSKLKYSFLLSDGKDVFALKLNKEGLTTQKSSLLIEESEDIIKLLKLTKGTMFNYSIINSDIKSECDKVLDNLSSKVFLIANRYEHTLTEIENNVLKSKDEVKISLERMGYKW